MLKFNDEDSSSSNDCEIIEVIQGNSSSKKTITSTTTTKNNNNNNEKIIKRCSVSVQKLTNYDIEKINQRMLVESCNKINFNNVKTISDAEWDNLAKLCGMRSNAHKKRYKRLLDSMEKYFTKQQSKKKQQQQQSAASSSSISIKKIKNKQSAAADNIPMFGTYCDGLNMCIALDDYVTSDEE